MKKILCIALVVLAALFVFTGCSGTANSMTGRNAMGRGAGVRNDQSNVSTSRDGTVNGRNPATMPGPGMGTGNSMGNGMGTGNGNGTGNGTAMR